MKNERIIVIKNPKLRKIRKCLRQILLEAKNHKYQELRELRKSILEERGPNDEEGKRINKLINQLFSLSAHSICNCNNGGSCLTLQKYKDNHQMGKFDFTDLDMAYYPTTKKWYCLECYRRTKAISEPENLDLLLK